MFAIDETEISTRSVLSFAAMYEGVQHDATCSRCGSCCKMVPFVTEIEREAIASEHGDEVIDGHNLAVKPDGFCIFHKIVEGQACCGLEGPLKPTSCRAGYCEEILYRLYGLSGESYYDFIKYCRRELRLEREGAEALGYD